MNDAPREIVEMAKQETGDSLERIEMMVALALIVQGLTMTSSPGSIPIAPIAAISPDVAEFTVTARLTPKYVSQLRSNS